MSSSRQANRRNRRTAQDGERGQTVILAAISMAVMLGMAGLAIDIGLLTYQRRDLQNAADAMALAGASQLKATTPYGHSQATNEADEWANYNGVDLATEKVSYMYDVTCDGIPEPNSMTVRLTRTQQTFLLRVLGKDSGTVTSCATATRYSPGGAIGMAPFGVEDDCVYGPDGDPNTDDAGEMDPGDIITIKYDANNDDGEACGSNTGNFWTLAIDDTGSGENCGPVPAGEEERKLKEAICWGAITPLCMPEAVAEGENCEVNVDTQTGNQVAAIKSGVNYIVANAPANCNILAEIIQETTVGGVTTYSLYDDCNPFLPGYVGPSLVKLIPVLDGLYPDANGKSNVPIVGFMTVVIDPAQVSAGGWCTGNECDLLAKIVGTGVNPLALRRALDDGATNNFTVLIK